MRKFPVIILFLLSLCFCCVFTVSADQVVPFYPMQNVTGNYTLSQGMDIWQVNTNMPISISDVVYPESLFDLIVATGIAFLLLATYFVSLRSTVPSIAITMCGLITFGTELAAALMAPLVGTSQTFLNVIPTIAANGSYALNSTNTIHVDHIITYTLSSPFSRACWGLASAGIIVTIAGALSFFSWFKHRGEAKSANGVLLDDDIEAAHEKEEWAGYKKPKK